MKFGEFGGRYVPEILIPPLEELEESYEKLKNDEKFKRLLNHYLEKYAGRPTPLYFAKNLTRRVGGAKLYLKREDLLHGGAHKINNTIGQALLAKFMGKKRLIAETGAGQHGVATSMAGALFGFRVEIYMGYEDMKRQRVNVYRMKLLGANVIPVKKGTQRLKDAINEALRDWVASFSNTHYLIGSAVGPHPFPTIVRDFQSVIGEETKRQILEAEGRLPSAIVACVGGGSNAIGIFYPFLKNEEVKLVGVEAGGMGINTCKNAATLTRGTRGVFHGMLSYFIQNEDGQIKKVHSIAPGLDYPGVGPEHAYLKESGRAVYTYVTDDEALNAFITLSREEGIIPALESAHAIAYGMKIAADMEKDDVVVINLSGRGDKDMESVMRRLSLCSTNLS